MIKAILIDIDNTLLDFVKSANKTIEIIFKQKGLPCNELTFKAFHEINDGLWKQIEKQEITKPEMYKLRWKMVLEKLNINEDPDEMELIFRSTLSGIAQPVDNAIELLDYLYEKYPLYAASNSSFEHQRKRLTNANMLKYFKEIFVSEKVGALKPAKEFFDVCLKDIKYEKPEDIVIIGDSLTSDILGGCNYGLKTIWFNYDKLPVPDYPKANYTVDSLPEIKNIL